MKLVTKQLKKKLPKNHKINQYDIIDSQNIDKIIKILRNNNKIEIYDLTFTENKKNLQIFSIKDHINRTGENPLRTRQKQLKIDFLDTMNLYEYKKNAVITDCCGTILNKKYLFPSHYLSNVSLIAKAIKINKFSAFLVNVL